MKIKKKLRKLGNSFGVIIDKSIKEKLNIKEGDFVEIDVKKIKGGLENE